MRYLWQDDASPVKEIQVLASKTRVPEAIFYAPEDFSAERMRHLPGLLSDRGYTVAFDEMDGRPVLRVGNFGSPDRLIDFLAQNNLVSGKTRIDTRDEKKPHGFGDYIKKNSLFLSAVFYTLGNISTMLSGHFRRDKDEFRTGMAFTIGDSTMLLFGRRNVSEKQQAVMHGLGEILQQNGVTLSLDSAFKPSAVRRNDSLWGKTRRFMGDKVIIVKSLSEMSAGAYFARAGFNQNNHFKTGAGAAVGTGFLLGLLTPEKTSATLREQFNAQDNKELNAKIAKLPLLTRIKLAIQRQPLFIPGFFAAINNILTLLGAWDERKYIKESKTGNSRKMDEYEAKLFGGSFKPSLFANEQKSDSLKTDYRNALESEAKLRREYDIISGDKDPTRSHHQRLQACANRLKQNKGTQYNYSQDPEYQDLELSLATARGAKLEEVELAHDEAKNHYLDIQKIEEKKKYLEEGRKVKLFGNEYTFNQKNFWLFNVAQGAFFLVANALYAISPKGAGTGDSKRLAERFFAAAATEIAKAPPEQQQYILNVTALYASQTDELGANEREARDLLTDKVKRLEEHPWLKAAGNPRMKAPVPPELLAPPVEERLDAPAAAGPRFAAAIGQKEKPVARSGDWVRDAVDISAALTPQMA